MPKTPEKLDISALHGLRALMVFMVAYYHIWQQSWLPQYGRVLGQWINGDYIVRTGYLFVDGMLLLSGFLLFLPYARQMMERTPVPDTRRFFLNRAARILPSYLFCVLVMLALVALPQGMYASWQEGAADVLAHLTFTFPFFYQTNLQTPLNSALWTVAVEVQFYLLFPFLARRAQRWPAVTLMLMALAGLLWRGGVAVWAEDTSLLVNQMPAFLDVYALGMAGAMVYVRLRLWLAQADRLSRTALSLLAAGLVALGIWGVLATLGMQCEQGLKGYEELRLGQLLWRLPFAAAVLCATLGLALMPRRAQWLMGNRLARFASVISYNFYIWHQVLAVQMREAWFADVSALHSDIGLQWAYTVLSISVSILVAAAVTYGLEQPLSRRIKAIIPKGGHLA